MQSSLLIIVLYIERCFYLSSLVFAILILRIFLLLLKLFSCLKFLIYLVSSSFYFLFVESQKLSFDDLSYDFPYLYFGNCKVAINPVSQPVQTILVKANIKLLASSWWRPFSMISIIISWYQSIWKTKFRIFSLLHIFPFLCGREVSRESQIKQHREIVTRVFWYLYWLWFIIFYIKRRIIFPLCSCVTTDAISIQNFEKTYCWRLSIAPLYEIISAKTMVRSSVKKPSHQLLIPQQLVQIFPLLDFGSALRVD